MHFNSQFTDLKNINVITKPPLLIFPFRISDTEANIVCKLFLFDFELMVLMVCIIIYALCMV